MGQRYLAHNISPYLVPNPGQIEVLQRSLGEKDAETAFNIVELSEKLRVAEETVQNAQKDLDNTLLSKRKEKEKDEGM